MHAGAEPQFVTALGLAAVPAADDAPERDRTGLVGEADLGDGRTVTCVPAQHFSARTPCDRNRTLWCGFVRAHRHG